jgi:SAM-dependent methyltransferase
MEQFARTLASPVDPETDGSKASPACRFCGARLRHTFVDLGMSPLCQTHISPEQLNWMEPFYPLHAFVCEGCFLVQLEEYVSPTELFTEYAYFSSYSDSWVEHARRYAEAMIRRLGLDAQSRVVELASNDGYLLQHFVRAGIPVLGVEPAANVAQVAVQKGIPTLVRFFGRDTAREIAEEVGRADLLLGNNVLAHVPRLNDFVAGMKILLKPGGVITMEFPHLYRLMEGNQFDTIYHEHFSYFSFFTAEKVFAAHGLTLFDVEELPTHGGSLRIYARHAENRALPVSAAVDALRRRELEAGVTRLETYASFAEQVKETKREILEFLIRAKRAGKRVAGYGAPGKGNTLLNYCGIRTDFLDYTVDRSPYKQGKFTPGTRIPILHPDKIAQTRPDYVFILPWNLKDEIVRQMAHVRDWGGKFVVPIPTVSVL